MWYRVFGTTDTAINPEALLSHIGERGWAATGSFRGDDAGWFEAAIIGAGETPLIVQRFLASEEGIRAELNAWAAHLETCADSPNVGRLMEHAIRTRQLFTIHGGGAGVCLGLVRFLAKTTEGVYQIDEQGFFDPDGVLLLQER